MGKNKHAWLLCLVVSVSGITLIAALHTRSQVGVAQNPLQGVQVKQADKVDRSHFPVADYVSTEPTDSKERAKREAKGKKYNRPETAVDPQLVTVFDIYHWDQNMPSLPVTESDAVIIGEVTGAQAHLSSDKTGIYSEFTIEICQILKNDAHTPLKFPGSVVVERTGGRVRFPSGQVSVMYVSGLGMPRVGQKYVLFLTHNFDYQVRRDEDYRILTGYELRDGRVVPLESSGVVNFDAHRGKDEQIFLAELKAYI